MHAIMCIMLRGDWQARPCSGNCLSRGCCSAILCEGSLSCSNAVWATYVFAMPPNSNHKVPVCIGCRVECSLMEVVHLVLAELPAIHKDKPTLVEKNRGHLQWTDDLIA